MLRQTIVALHMAREVIVSKMDVAVQELSQQVWCAGVHLGKPNKGYL